MCSSRVEVSGPSFNAEGLYIRFGDILGPFVEEVGVSPQALTDPNVLVPLDKHCRLLECAARRRGDDFIGLKIGTRVEPRDMGPLGYTILNSPTVLAALKSFVRYLRVYARGCEMELDVQGDTAYFKYRYTITDPSAVGRRQEAECTLAMLKHVVELITSRKLELEAVGFEHPKPEDTSKHIRVFEAPLYFAQDVNFLKFKASVLDRETAHAEHRLFEVLEEHLAQVLEALVEEDNLVAKVGSAIAQSLSNGVPSIDEIAAALFMTKRTLQRRLADEGVLYNEYADEIRRKLAVQYVKDTKIPLTEVAFLLGYSHVSAFSRAFRRWMGQSPNAFRESEAAGAVHVSV
jgi:AraC-like DNA-binding protein